MTQAHKQRGFTLIELLVVVAIIGLLASIVIASLNTARIKGRDARRVADVKQISLALEMSNDAAGQYPVNAAASLTSYIAAVPTDPKSNLAYAYAALQGFGTSAAVCASYHLGAKLESATSPSLTSAPHMGVGGTYPAADGAVCTSGSWGGNADVATLGGDFSGASPVFDIRP